jgi:hydrogenase maturation protease
MTGGHDAAIVVIGVGSEYRRDDGVGPAVLTALAGVVPAAVALVASDGEPTRLVEAWTGAPVAIVVDAVAGSGAAPGELYRLEITTVTGALPAEPGASSHDLGVGSAVALARALDRMPGRLIVHGVEGADFSQGITMSPPVAARIGELTDAVLADVHAAVGSR